jgi:hypothetical protein
MSEMNQIKGSNSSSSSSFTHSLQETQSVGNEVEQSIKEAVIAQSDEKFQKEAEENFSAAGINIRLQKLERRSEVKTEKAKQAKESVLVRKEDADGMADQFSGRNGNREFQLSLFLLSLLAQEIGSKLNENTAIDEIIHFVSQGMSTDGINSDPAIVDKTFEFLLEVTQYRIGQSEGSDQERLTKIYKNFESAKSKHFGNNLEAIQVAQKIIGAVDAVAQATGAPLQETLAHYRDIVHNPPDLQTLRKYYEEKGYKEMLLEFKGLSKYLGANLKRANLENPEIMQLVNTAKTMQALVNVFRQSKIQCNTVENYLESKGVIVTS